MGLAASGFSSSKFLVHGAQRHSSPGIQDAQQFANYVELRQRYDRQKPPQPDASGVLELALHGSLLILLNGGPDLR